MSSEQQEYYYIVKIRTSTPPGGDTRESCKADIRACLDGAHDGLPGQSFEVITADREEVKVRRVLFEGGMFTPIIVPAFIERTQPGGLPQGWRALI